MRSNDIVATQSTPSLGIHILFEVGRAISVTPSHIMQARHFVRAAGCAPMAVATLPKLGPLNVNHEPRPPRGGDDSLRCNRRSGVCSAALSTGSSFALAAMADRTGDGIFRPTSSSSSPLALHRYCSPPTDQQRRPTKKKRCQPSPQIPMQHPWARLRPARRSRRPLRASPTRGAVPPAPMPPSTGGQARCCRRQRRARSRTS